MQYTALSTPPAGFTSQHRLYDTLMQRIDPDLVTWNFTGFKMSLLTLSPQEQQKLVDAKQASLMKYRKQLVQLESSISHPEDQSTRELMQAGGDLDALARIENEIHTL
jgi:hypothetical protein